MKELSLTTPIVHGYTSVAPLFLVFADASKAALSPYLCEGLCKTGAAAEAAIEKGTVAVAPENLA